MSMKKVSLMLVIVFMLMCSVIPVTSAEDSLAGAPIASGLLDEGSKSIALSSTKTLIVDKTYGQIQMLDISEKGVTLQWSMNFEVIYDFHVTLNPTKISIITSESNKIKKVTLSGEGGVLSEQIYPIKGTENSLISWFPKLNKDKEKIAVVIDGTLSVYQYPWKKPVFTLNTLTPEDDKYNAEVILIKDVKVQPNFVVIKMTGDSSAQSQDFYRIINLTTKKKLTVTMERNVNSDFTLEGSELVVNTSSQVGHPLGIDTSVDHIIYARYDLKTGAKKLAVTRKFTSIESNWSTHYFNNKLWLIDTEQNKMTALDQKGKVFAEIQADAPAEVLNLRMIGYYNGQPFFVFPMKNVE